MPPSQLDDLQASIRELEAHLPTADPQSRAILEQQIEAMRSTAALLRGALPQIEEMKKQRVALSPEVARFFTPEPPAPVPSWIPDDTTRGALREELMRCPAGGKVYWEDSSVGCAIPQGAGSIPIRDGLELSFHSTGGLRSQAWYEMGLLRWSIEYHPTGGRAAVGFCAATEPKTYPEQGLVTRYAPNGTVTVQGHFHAGVAHGWSKQWEDDGYPIGATLFDRGRAVESVLPDGSRRPA